MKKAHPLADGLFLCYNHLEVIELLQLMHKHGFIFLVFFHSLLVSALSNLTFCFPYGSLTPVFAVLLVVVSFYFPYTFATLLDADIIDFDMDRFPFLAHYIFDVIIGIISCAFPLWLSFLFSVIVTAVFYFGLVLHKFSTEAVFLITIFYCLFLFVVFLVADTSSQSAPTPPAASSSHSSADSFGAGSWGTDKTTNEIIGPISRTVYWVSGGKSYHFKKSCPSLSRSTNIHSGSLSDAVSAGKTDPCNNCT